MRECCDLEKSSVLRWPGLTRARAHAPTTNLRCARHHENSEAMAAAAALALLRLCTTSDDAEVIARERAMDWLREAMQRFPDNAEITEHAASLLAVLDGFRAKNSRVEKALDEAGLDEFRAVCGASALA